MTEPDKGSIEGQGREELLPERGDPFSKREAFSSTDKPDLTADVFPEGLERVQERDGSLNAKDQLTGLERPMPRIGPPEDGGMRAVGPPLPEDLMEDNVPPPIVEPELPHPPDMDISSLMSDLGSGMEPSADDDEVEAIPSRTLSDSKADNILVSELRWRRLHAKADLLQKRVTKEIDNPHLKQLLHDQIAIACDEHLETREQFEESERILNEVDGRIHLEEQVQKWSASLKTWILAYEFVFTCLLIIVLLLLPSAVRDLFPSWFLNLSLTVQSNIGTMLRAMLWGGLGGAASALVGIWAHRTFNQKLDRQWAIWFFANPFMGIVLGALIFLLSRAVLLGLFPSIASRFQAVWILYGISLLAGFKQNVFYDIFERLLKVFETGRGKK